MNTKLILPFIPPRHAARLALAAGLALATSLHGQQPPAPAPGAPPAIAAAAAEDAAVVHAQDRKLLAEMRRAGQSGKRVEVEARSMGGGWGISPRALVIPPADADDEKLTKLDEDLAVMSRIFSKALDKGGSRDGAFRVFFGGHGSPGDFDTLYLDGFGAVFVLAVDYPIVAPAKTAKKGDAGDDEQDKTWEQARRELQRGAGAGYVPDPNTGMLVFEDGGDDDSQRMFDEQRVSELKRKLTGALKHAANLSAVKADESVTVVVFGRSGGRREMVWSEAIAMGGPHAVTARPVTEARRQQLTLRVQKADIDAFAKGRLNLEEFTRKVAVSTR